MDEEASRERLERAALKRAASGLGWKLIGRETVEIKIRRTFEIGPRTVAVSGRVGVPLPPEMTVAAGEAALAPIVDPVVGRFLHAMGRAAAKMLGAPDDVVMRHRFESGSFFTALEDARRTLLREYGELENRRIDAHVETQLGLEFYLEGLAQPGRRFEYFVGPTNSGKTHAALEVLAAAPSGTYLAPLRLLALEVRDRLSDAGVATSLVTGEERAIVPGASHVSSTVEMLDLGRAVDVAIVDEAQMLADEQRGWAWTLAVAGVRASRVILCGSVDGLQSAQRLATRLGAEIAVRDFERKNPLAVVASVPLTELRAGDAVVAFTRRDVVELQRKIRQLGRSTAAIYGSLSPAVRRRQAERFRAGAADVLVATDAIGLGLNLPIARLVFASMEKFDGTSLRKLTSAEMRQIAGRAGRYGIHERGEVTTLERRDLAILRSGLERFSTPGDVPIWIAPTPDHLARLAPIIGTERLSRLLQFFATRVRRGDDTDLRIADLAETIDVALALESADAFARLPLEVRAIYSRAPVTTRGFALGVLVRWAERHAFGEKIAGEELRAHGNVTRDRLLHFEDRSRLATVYLWLAQRFPKVYTGAAAVAHERERLDEAIGDELRNHGKRAALSAPRAPHPRKRRFDKRKLPR